MANLSRSTSNDNTIEKMMGAKITTENAEKVERYLGYEPGRERPAKRRIRHSTSPDFEVLVRDEDNEYKAYRAYIVSSNVPIKGEDPIPGGVLAVAATTIGGDEWFFLLTHGEGYDNESRTSDSLIKYEGEPEELLKKDYLFDEE